MSAKQFKTPQNTQAFYYLLILLSVGMMVWEKAKPGNEVRLWFLLLWFFIMLFAFFKATKNWAHDNPKPSVEELLEEAEKKEEEKKKSPEIKDVDIPDLGKMVENLKKQNKND